ncbi:MAG: ATP-binding protein, partial [candidate division WOR-3 bacterium]|nr:ATP-binding protein [candidate division WOR-3 bacterium]
YTGGSESTFSILYFINIIAGSFFLLTKGGMVLAALSAAGYLLLLLGEYFGFLISPYALETNLLIDTLIIRIYINALAYFLIAAIAGFLSERLQKGREEILTYRVRLRDIINNIQSAIIILNENDRVMDFNRSAKQLMPGIELNRSIYNTDINVLSRIKYSNYFQFTQENKHYDVRVENLRHGNVENNTILIINDITRLKEYERKFLEKERMSAIGELAASIAHEIRNPLSSIKGSVNILRDEMGSEAESHPMFRVTLEEIERLNHLINEFLVYSSRGSANIESINLSRTIDKINNLLNIDCLETDNISDDTVIYADYNKFKQIMINLLHNALDAVKDREDKLIRIRFSENTENHIIDIIDNGPGVDKSIEDKIFHPFVSSKPGGTGLGLAIVYKIVREEHSGSIEYIRENNMTIFRVTLERKHD